MCKDKQKLIQLVSDVQNGVDGAFDKLYHETLGFAYAKASLFLRNEQDIEDALQNSYIKVVQNINNLRNPESFESWFGVIIKHECQKYIIKNKKITDAFSRFKNIKEAELLTQEDITADGVIEKREVREAVNKIIASLPEDKRICLVMFYFEQNTVSEISEITGVPEGTVLSRIYYARKKIEAEISKLRKKDDSLFGVSAIPLVVSLLAFNVKNITVPAALEGSVIAAVTAAGEGAAAVATATTATASASATGAAASSVSTAVTGTAATGASAAGAATATATAAVATKVAAVAVAASVAVGGGVATVNHVKTKNEVVTTQAVITTLTEEHATVAAFVTQPSTEPETSVIESTDNTAASSTVQHATVSVSQTERLTAGETAAELTEETEKATTRKRISREYTLEAPDTTAIPSTLKNTTTTEPERTRETEPEETEEETTEKTTAKTTKKTEKTTEKQTVAEKTTVDASELYGVSGGVINEYTGDGGNISIPSKIGSDNVTAIGTGAFEGNTDITGVSLPSGVTRIGQMAFSDCTRLSSVTLPSTLESIGIGSFYGCTSLSSVTVPSGVTSIGDDAFADCSSLRSITIPSSVASIGENAFGGCDGLTIRCEEGSAAHDYAIENSINFELI